MTTEERMTEVEQRCKSNTHRIDELAGDVKVLADLTASVKVLATKQENVEAVVREIKTDVKALTEAPARKWDTLIKVLVTALVTGLVGWVLGKIL